MCFAWFKVLLAFSKTIKKICSNHENHMPTLIPAAIFQVQSIPNTLIHDFQSKPHLPKK